MHHLGHSRAGTCVYLIVCTSTCAARNIGPAGQECLMRGGIHQQAEVVWANVLEMATREVIWYLGLEPGDDLRRDEISWAAAAGLAAGLEILMGECARRDLTLNDLAAVVHEEREQLALHRARVRPTTD